MRTSFRKMIPPAILERSRRIQEFLAWRARGYAAPSPNHVKRMVLARVALPNATWVETGTYLGDTTAFLSSRSRAVITIEPEPSLYRKAAERFKRTSNVRVIEGRSEDVMPEVLASLSGPTCFWLDGHTSGGITYSGPLGTPIEVELTAIEARLAHITPIVVVVDDVRLFSPEGEQDGYPPLDTLVQWATRNGLEWAIEHDMFIGRRTSAPR
jgi:hypothetical protein